MKVWIGSDVGNVSFQEGLLLTYFDKRAISDVRYRPTKYSIVPITLQNRLSDLKKTSFNTKKEYFSVLENGVAYVSELSFKCCV